jgi:hypothetical protein
MGATAYSARKIFTRYSVHSNVDVDQKSLKLRSNDVDVIIGPSAVVLG